MRMIKLGTQEKPSLGDVTVFGDIDKKASKILIELGVRAMAIEASGELNISDCSYDWKPYLPKFARSIKSVINKNKIKQITPDNLVEFCDETERQGLSKVRSFSLGGRKSVAQKSPTKEIEKLTEDFKRQIQDLKQEYEVLRRADYASHAKQIQELKQEYAKEIQELKQENEIMRKSHAKEIQELKQENAASAKQIQELKQENAALRQYIGELHEYIKSLISLIPDAQKKHIRPLPSPPPEL